MARKLDNGGYICGFCGKVYFDGHNGGIGDQSGRALADRCEYGHNLIFVPFTKEELKSLMLFFFTKNQDVLNPLMYERIRKLANKN